MPYHSVRRRRKSKSSTLPLLFLFLLILIISFGAIYIHGNIYQPKDSEDKTYKRIIIEKDLTASHVADILSYNELISSKIAFIWYLKTQNLDASIKAGDYALSPSQNVPEISEIISQGKTTKLWLTFPEGWRLSQYAERLHANNILDGEDFINKAQHLYWISEEKRAKWWFLKDRPVDHDLEGYLFPDTYLIDHNIGSLELISLLLNTMMNKLEPLRSQIESSGKNIHDLLTIASILERETGSYEDKRMIADIFYKRLQAGISLGADPTVLYALNDWKAILDKEALDINSPYNTRKHRGLPPGPICSPSLDSIKAALSPKENPYYYFLATQKTGQIIYSKNLDEHNLNKAKYLR